MIIAVKSIIFIYLFVIWNWTTFSNLIPYIATRMKKLSVLRKDSTPLPEPSPLSSFPRLAKNPFPLHAAAYSGNLPVLMHILADDSCLDKYPPFDPHGASIMHLAARANSTETLRWLLAQKRYERISGVYWLSALAVGKGGDTPAHVAAVRGNLESFQVLWESTEEKVQLMRPDYNGFSPLELAASKGHDKVRFCNAQTTMDVYYMQYS